MRLDFTDLLSFLNGMLLAALALGAGLLANPGFYVLVILVGSFIFSAYGALMYRKGKESKNEQA